MTPERWQQVKKVLAAALEREPVKRAAYLDQVCSEPSLRREVESLIAAHEQGDGSFMEHPAVQSGTLRTGTKLGPYEIVAPLGVGGMGEVYRARDSRLDREVALKVLPAGLLTDEAARRRFRKETLALAKLNNPHIAVIHDVGEEAGVDYLVMECVPGQSLAEKLKSGALPEKEVASYGAQIAEALEEAHEHGVIHRDLKPGNIMVTPKGQVKVLDFGLAKLLCPASDTMTTESFAETQGIAGTLPYMAPEQLTGEPVEARTDIYALGTVLFEMAVGRRPFQEESAPRLTDAILHQAPVPPRALNSRVSPDLERIILKCLEKSPENRYQSAKEVQVDLRHLSAPTVPATAEIARSRLKRWKLLVPAAVLVVGLIAGGLYVRSLQATRLTERDTIVLADFTNTTGDEVFDDTLKQALAVDLGQSPFLNILSEDKVRQTLQQMTRTPSERLTQGLAREVCQRAGSKAYLAGSIAALGTEYVIGLEALNCATGDVLAREQVTAGSKEQVLPALGQAATKLRNEVGESLSSVQKFDVPLRQATTYSLEALKAFTLGVKTSFERGDVEAIPFYKRAVELDPNFALAYGGLGIDYSNLNQPGLAANYIKKAFDLSDRITEHEKFHVTALYYGIVTGELEKANQNLELGIQVYPRDWIPHGELSSNYMILGQYEKAATETRETLHLEPGMVVAYGNLGEIYLALNRFNEARITTEEALRRKLDSIPLHLNLYGLAFFQGNAAAMKQQEDWAIGKPGAEDSMLSLESDTEAWSGRLRNARDLSRRAVESTRRSDEKEPAALWQANAAIREALFGNVDVARQDAAASVALAPRSHDAEVQAALAYALASDAAHAQSLADDLAKRFPRDTVIQSVWLPTIHAQIENGRKDAARSIELLHAATPYELGMMSASPNSCLYPVYVRAMAYLSAQQDPAVAEFQKIIDHRGLLWNCATGALAHLGLARAYMLQGDSAKSRAAYHDFLTLWKDADPDIPILKEAKAEYAKLQ